MNIAVIELNNFELKLCKALAEERQKVDTENHVTDKKISTVKSGFEIGFQGTKGEIAVARYLNVYPDFTTHVRSGGHDLLYWRKKIDVKNAHPHKDLMTPTWKKLGSADIYICVTGDNPIYIIGWCHERELITPERVVTWTPVPSYFMKHEELRDIDELKYIT